MTDAVNAQAPDIAELARRLREILTPSDAALLGVELLRGLLRSAPDGPEIAAGADYAAAFGENAEGMASSAFADQSGP